MTTLDPKALEVAQTEKMAQAMYEHDPHKRQEPWGELLICPDPYWMGKAKAAFDAVDVVDGKEHLAALENVAAAWRDDRIKLVKERDEDRHLLKQIIKSPALETDNFKRPDVERIKTRWDHWLSGGGEGQFREMKKDLYILIAYIVWLERERKRTKNTSL